ncbi:MAG: MFS transporter [Acidobacteriota bacterium]|nr:MFS transporter [Acidobacteriota bacterium]
MHCRWRICALLFFATTINYIDRQVFSLLAPELQRSIGWSEAQYGYIITSFQTAYAIGLLVMGRVMDRLGTRRGYTIVISWWSLAAAGHALASTALGFGIARFFLGLGESGNFPAAIKTIAEWFPRRQRALATGIFNAGANIGAVIAPLTVPWVARHYGWRGAFVATGLFSATWLVCWLAYYRRPEEHRGCSAAELQFIRSDPPDSGAPVSWRHLIGLRQTWAFILAKLLTDPIWWFYLYWLPKFFYSRFGLTLDKIGPPLVIVYLSADVGSIGGGWLSSFLIARGWSVNRARKTALLACALAVIPIVTVAQSKNVWYAVAVLSLATAAHQGWSANLFTLVSDMFPRNAVGTVVGMGGSGGAVGGMVVATIAGLILQATGSYVPLFLMAGSFYLVAFGLVQLFAPKLEMVR